MGRVVIPPGRAGLIVLAVAAVPIVIKKFKPVVRWTGRKLSEAGARVTKMADEVERYDREKASREGHRSASSSTQAEAGAQQKTPKRSPKAGTVGTSPPANNPKTKRKAGKRQP